MSKKMRLGRVKVMHEGYVVDLDNAIMVQEAKIALREDLETVTFEVAEDKKASENDIPEFLTEATDYLSERNNKADGKR